MLSTQGVIPFMYGSKGGKKKEDYVSFGMKRAFQGVQEGAFPGISNVLYLKLVVDYMAMFS